MLKKIVLASALVAGSAFAQQNVDISGASFQSGSANAQLAELGRKAAADGNRLIITAPPEWHARIAAAVRAGGAANVVMRDGFYETVLVRVEPAAPAPSASAPDRAETQAALEAASKARAEAEIARAEAERNRAEAERAKAEAERMRMEAERAKREAEAAKAAAEAAQAQAEAVTATAAATRQAAEATPARAEAGSSAIEEARRRLETSVNGGRSAVGTLTVARLQSGDTLYVDGDVRAVTRREGRAIVMYWLDGDLDLRRTELRPLGTNRYQVLSQIRGEGRLREEQATILDARIPAAKSEARLALERQLNDGRTVTESLEPARLVKDDILYVNGDAVLVVRRIGRDLVRYWLVGSFDPTQTGVQADGTNRYKVLTDTVR